MITSKDTRMMETLKKFHKLSSHSRYKMVAALVKSGRILSIGVNKEGAPKPFIKKHRDNIKLHAEVDCLVGIDKNISRGSTLYVSGETTKTAKPLLCFPCDTCLFFSIEKMEVKRVVYLDRSGLGEWMKKLK